MHYDNIGNMLNVHVKCNLTILVSCVAKGSIKIAANDNLIMVSCVFYLVLL